MTDLARLHLIRKGVTNKELEVVYFTTLGHSNQDTAGKLKVSVQTVKFHLTSVFKKLCVKNRMHLTVYVLQNGGLDCEAYEQKYKEKREAFLGGKL